MIDGDGTDLCQILHLLNGDIDDAIPLSTFAHGGQRFESRQFSLVCVILMVLMAS